MKADETEIFRAIAIAFAPRPSAASTEHAESFSPGERAYADGLRFEKRRRDWIGGRLAAKAAVARLLRQEGKQPPGPPEIEVVRGKNGEPLLGPHAALAGIGVSISHSGELAVAAAFRPARSGAVGIDLEPIAPVDPAIFETAFTGAERALLDEIAAAGRDELALCLWTAKEAVLKAMGVGLSVPLHVVEVAGLGPDLAWRAEIQVRAQGRRFAVHRVAREGYVVALAMEGVAGVESH